MHKIKRQFIKGFSIIEILVVIVVIGILSTISVVSYVQVQHRAIDSSVDSDVQRMDIKQLSYKYNNGSLGKAYDSLNGPDADLDFTPINGNVINVAVNSSGYCIRGYNTKGTKNSIVNAFIKESTTNICSTLPPIVATPTPVDLVATVASSTSINLSWGATTGATNYILQRDTNSSFTTATQIASQSGTTFTSSGLSQGTIYYFRVNETNPVGISDWSDTASAITTIATPTAPTVAASTAGATTTYTWGSTCLAGTTARYQYTYYTSAGSNSGWVATASTSFAATTSSEGYTYSLFAQAQCYSANATSTWSASSNTAAYYHPMTTQAAPVITVTLSGSNILAAISPAVTCTSGTIQYGIRSRTNDGTWSSYSAWSSTTTASQAASDGVKYGYQAQDRCYIDATNPPSATATGIESTYIDAIATPAAPTVAANTVGATTTYTWNNTCVAGTTARYQYTYYTSAGYNSGWVATASASFAATTSSEGYTYSLFAQAQCYSANATSAWSASSNTASYYRPLTTPALTATAASSTSINLSWTAITGATNYVLQRDTNSSFTTATQIVSQAGITFTSSGLTPGNTYYYRVNDVQPGGTSGWSNTASAITTINVPTAPTVAANTVGVTTTYTWGSTCAAGTTARYRYTYYTSAGSNSGWVATASASFAATTSAEGYTYSLFTQTQCYTAATTSAWSASSNTASYYRPIMTTVLVVAGGGGGGSGAISTNNGGGGGGGGVVNVTYTVTPGSKTVTVGSGGAQDANGNNSVFDTIIATGGGKGGGLNPGSNGGNGGSGGGGGVLASTKIGGLASPTGQGNNGANGNPTVYPFQGGGGGGAGQIGNTNGVGYGGNGVANSITGASVIYGGGGGGAADASPGMGGAGGGGNGVIYTSGTGGVAGRVNTGGGGGGGASQGSSIPGGAGGSGIVIISYPTGSMTATGGTITTSGVNTIHTFTSSGTFTIT